MGFGKFRTPLIVAGLLGLWWLAPQFRLSAFAQDAVFAKMNGLAERKGYKDTGMGTLCREFKWAGRAGDKQCRANQTSWDDDERRGDPPNRSHLFNTFVEFGTGKTRIILVVHDGRNADAFATDLQAELLGVARGNKVGNGWVWSAVRITPELRAKFEKEKRYWTHPEQVADVEKLPDR